MRAKRHLDENRRWQIEDFAMEAVSLGPFLVDLCARTLQPREDVVFTGRGAWGNGGSLW